MPFYLRSSLPYVVASYLDGELSSEIVVHLCAFCAADSSCVLSCRIAELTAELSAETAATRELEAKLKATTGSLTSEQAKQALQQVRSPAGEDGRCLFMGLNTVAICVRFC